MPSSRLAVMAGAMLIAGCDAPREAADASPDVADAPPVRPREASPSVPVDDEPFYNPLMELAKIPGPTPVFEQDDDENGNRYVVGEGFYVDTEDGEPLPLPAVMTATPAELDDEEIAEALAAYDDAVIIEPPPKIHADIVEHVDSVDPSELVEVLIDIRSDEPGLRVDLDRALAQGKILMKKDWDDERDILLAEREERVLLRTEGVVADIEASDGVVLYRGEQSAWVHALVPAYAVSAIATRPDVISLDPNSTDGVSLSHGEVVQDGAQIRQFIQNGWTGGTSGNSGLVVGIVEVDSDASNAFHPDHAAWKNATTYRFAYNSTGRWNCHWTPPLVFPTCAAAPPFPNSPHNHATRVAAILFGDFTKGQLPSVPVGERDMSSGYARDARAHFYMTWTHVQVVAWAYSHLRSLPSNQEPPYIVNNSFRFGSNCTGTTFMSRAANSVFKDGIAMIAGAGNDGGSSTSCTVGAPGDALGVFTVGGHMDVIGADAIDVRTAPIWSNSPTIGSAWGGNATQGQNRSIIDVTAPARRRCFPTTNGSQNCSSTSGAGTSYSAPTVTGTAIDIMDYHMSGGSNWITAPSALYSMLLLMGDRQAQSGKAFMGADHRWGVGRLRARWMSSGGMDAPYYWYHGAVCLSHSQTWDFQPFGTGALPDDVEAVKAAAYWYDHRHDTTGQVANVNMYLRTATSPVRSDVDAYDNKASIFVLNWANEPLVLRFSGANVNGHHDPACSGSAPNNKIKVYFAIFAEDSDRESPTYNPSDGSGIYPEYL